MFRPFVMNSNICTSAADVASFDAFMDAVAGNVGNSYITYALLKELGGRLSNLRHIPSVYGYDFSQWEHAVDVVNNECTHMILCLQDQIRIEESYGLKLPYEQIIQFLKRVQKPILVAGLGANSLGGFDNEFHRKLNADLVQFLRKLSDCVDTIGVRGEFTREVLSKLGVTNVQTIGCPSFYESGRGRRIVKKPWSENLRFAMCSRVPQEWKSNYDVRMYLQDRQVQEEWLIRSVMFGEPCPPNPPPLEMKLIKEGRVKIFSDIGQWKTDMRTNDFSVGYRVHGSILALNSGVPAVVLNNDSRAREMCEFLNIPHCPKFDKDRLHDLYEACDYDKMNRAYDEQYEAYASFLSRQGFKLADYENQGGDSCETESLVVYGETSNEDAPVVSVLIPYYNDAKYLPQAIESVLSQSYRSFELILVNHATTDNCREIAHGYDDPRIVHVDMPQNYGAGTGLILRKALEVARGKYFKPFCADDVMRPNCLGDLVSYMELHPEKGFAFGNVEYVDAEGMSFGKYFFANRTKDTRSEIDCLRRFAKYESFLPYIGSIFRTAIVPVHDVDTVCIMLFDVSLWLRMLVEGHKIGFLNRIVSGYRIHEGQVSAIGHLARAEWLSWFEGEIYYSLFSSLRDLDVAKDVFADATYIEQMTDVADLRFVLSIRMMEQRVFANHQAYSYLRGLLNDDKTRDYLERKYGFTIRSLRELYKYEGDETLKGWYRRCGINNLSNRDALKIIFWHLYKICNPFSSLYKKRRKERIAAKEQFSC